VATSAAAAGFIIDDFAFVTVPVRRTAPPNVESLPDIWPQSVNRCSRRVAPLRKTRTELYVHSFCV
jgi:hypothetical protein